MDGHGDARTREYIYLGQYKANWNITIIEDTYDYWSWRHSSSTAADRYKLIKDFGVVSDHKWEHYFLVEYSNGWEVTTLSSNPKIAERITGEDASNILALIEEKKMPRYAPERVTNKYSDFKTDRNKQSVKAKFHSLGDRRK